MKCKSCKMEIPNDWKFYSNCGTPIDQKAPETAMTSAQPYKKTSIFC